jgi:hypothetical protein
MAQAKSSVFYFMGHAQIIRHLFLMFDVCFSNKKIARSTDRAMDMVIQVKSRHAVPGEERLTIIITLRGEFHGVKIGKFG